MEVTDQRKRRQEAREKRSRDLVDGLIEYISLDNENYKYVIIASKENANMIMEEVLFFNPFSPKSCNIHGCGTDSH
jgi:hypothetical protein